MYPAAPEPVSEYLHSRQGSKKNILEDESVSNEGLPSCHKVGEAMSSACGK